jgi:Co/Zn/Cd efflux system component
MDANDPNGQHAHPHPHEAEHAGHSDHDHDHDDDHSHSLFGRLQEAIPFLHGHSHGEVTMDAALESSEQGIRALQISLLLLGATALFQLVIVLISGSVGLLADTIHNFGDALTAVPLWIAFVLGRRAATRRYTYGYGRAEDAAGVLVVGLIFVSALVAAYESIQKLLHPQPLNAIG